MKIQSNHKGLMMEDELIQQEIAEKVKSQLGEYIVTIFSLQSRIEMLERRLADIEMRKEGEGQ